MEQVAYIAYFACAAVYLILALILVSGKGGNKIGLPLVTLAIMTSLWAVFGAFTIGNKALLFYFISQITEVLRNIACIWFLLNLLSMLMEKAELKGTVGLKKISIFIPLLALFFDLLIIFVGNNWGDVLKKITFSMHLALAILIVVLAEQVFRNTRADQRWGIKYLFLGIGGLFIFEFYLYAYALLFQGINAELLYARPLIFIVVAPLIAVSAARNPSWTLDIFVSRKVVFHSASLFVSGGYLVLMSLAGYYIKKFGGSWGGVAQTVFIFVAATLLLLIFFSGKARSVLKVFVNKHFFNYKYDYREEWIRFSNTLSDSRDKSSVPNKIIKAIAGLIDSPAGVLFVKDQEGGYSLLDSWNYSSPSCDYISGSSSLFDFFEQKKWIIDLDEYSKDREKYKGLQLPDVLKILEEPRIIIPLLNEDRIVAIVILRQPRSPRSFNWEDFDLFKIAGVQAASHLTQSLFEEELSISRQFEACSRLSTFVIHDLKNVTGQLSLIIKNAEKHRHNQQFINDVFLTVENSVEKMNHLLMQLKIGDKSGHAERVNIVAIIEKQINDRRISDYIPKLENSTGSAYVYADSRELGSVLGHIIQNAYDATKDGDRDIKVAIEKSSELALLTITDNGCGMDDDFIRRRLFSPFDTTKGDSGMGVGAYQAKEYINRIGGQINVESKVGTGSVFTITLPLAQEDSEA